MISIEKLKDYAKKLEFIHPSLNKKVRFQAPIPKDFRDVLILLNSDVKPIIIKGVKDETLIQLILPIKTY